MSVNKSGWLVRLAVGLAVVLAGAGLSRGQILIDDFEDRNDLGWTRVDSITDDPWGPPIYDLEDREYRMGSTGIVPVGRVGAVASLWDDSADPMFLNGFFRARMRASQGSNAFLCLRAVPFGPAICMGGNTVRGDFWINDSTVGGDLDAVLDDPEMVFHPDEDWIVEAGAVGDLVTLKAWRPGESEPAAPQLSIHTSLTSGLFGVGTQRVGMAARVNAAFDDIYFRVPEPSSSLLLLFGAIGVVAIARRHKN